MQARRRLRHPTGKAIAARGDKMAVKVISLAALNKVWFVGLFVLYDLIGDACALSALI
jgi:hypothetical protein